MIYLESKSTDPCFNLSLEQFVFDEMNSLEDYFMLWQNDNAIIVGKHQNTIEEINQKYVEDNHIKVVRRLSGGGAVYHDLGNLNYTFIVNTEKSTGLSLKVFCEKINEALGAFGIPAQVSGRNDITIDGKKFSGNAQYIKNGRVMHHGTLMFDSNLDAIKNALRVGKDKIESKGVKSVRSRVTNIKDYLDDNITLDMFKVMLIKYMFKGMEFKTHSFKPEDIKRIEEIQAIRYNMWEWNYGISPAYNLKKTRRIECVGEIQIYLEVKDGIITHIEFHGDYFSLQNSKTLEDLLKGKTLERESLKRVLGGVKISQYFSNLTQEDFLEILLQ